MWTHLVPYLGEEKTAETIHRVARIGLWRAINLERLIILAGSGVTRFYGQKSWRESLRIFVQLTLEEFYNPSVEPEANNFLQTSPEQSNIKDQIEMLCQIKDEGDLVNFTQETGFRVNLDKIDALDEQLFVAVDLCEELLAKMGKGRAGQSRLKEVRQRFSEYFKPKGQKPLCTDIDPIEAIFKFTRTQRILTTNYDTEFEKWLYKNKRLVNAEEEELEAYKKLIGAEYCEAAGDNELSLEEQQNKRLLDALTPLPRRIEVHNALARRIVSSSLDSSNVGDLLNFASYARSSEAQIFHLHGRYDRPEDLVVTQNDYRRIYAEDPRSDQAFQSAQEVLFAGNDVLMLGFGLGEEDVLRPFRQFVVRGRAPSHAPRRTFALLPTYFGEGYEVKNAEVAVRFALNYEIYTIFYGGPVYREIMDCLEKAENKTFDFEQLKESLSKLKGKSAYKKLLPAGMDLTSSEIAKVKTEVMSRALVEELKDLNKFSRDWWDAWRHSPHERKARYHIADKAIAGKSHYLRVRHCMESGIIKPEDGGDKGFPPESWQCLKQAKQTAEEQLDNKIKLKIGFNHIPKGVRILRFTMLRGAGQGTFVRLLHNEQNQKYLFGLTENNQQYYGAFIAHLSFSMEFTSVIKALARFFAIKLAKWINQYVLKRDITQTAKQRWDFTVNEFPDENIKTVNKNYPELYYESFLRLVKKTLNQLRNIKSLQHDRTFERLLRNIKRAQHQGLKLPDRLDNCNDIYAFIEAQFNNQELYNIARAIAVARWEDDQELVARPFQTIKEEVTIGTPREHRLDVLRRLMHAYEVVVSGDPNGRLFVCLSGLERITDDFGDAYNPSHRALFRLLTNMDERAANNTPSPPIDLVLVAGRPNAPICYLSKEWDSKLGDPLPGDEKKYSRLSRANRVLEKWSEIERIDWDSRAKVFGFNPQGKNEKNAINLAKLQERSYIENPEKPDLDDHISEDIYKHLPIAFFLNWAKETDSASTGRPLTQLHGSRRIHRLLWEHNALSIWVMAFWHRQEIAKEEEKSTLVIRFHNFIRELDAIAGRRGFNGVVEYIIRQYHDFDMNRKNSSEETKNKNLENKLQDKQSCDVDPELHRLILRHLTLFALPVEAWVLLGCPKIFDHLRNIYIKKFKEAARDNSELNQNTKWEHFPLRYWHERTWKLHQLKKALELLADRSLILFVHPAADNKQANKCPEVFLHGRYSLHNLMRQHLARSMQLAVHDGADINHHRMSIYCDQPRDIPSPTERHFNLIDGIVNRQTEYCRKTLHATYQHSREKHYTTTLMKEWDSEDEFCSENPDNSKNKMKSISPSHLAAERVYAPTRSTEDEGAKNLFDLYNNRDNEGFFVEDWDNPKGIGGALGHIHAAPQRLRAMLSLIQGSFSIGSLSRLKMSRRGIEEEKPFDAYRNWISKLLNIGTSLERTREEISNVFCERLLQGSDANCRTKWLEVASDDTKLQAQNTYKNAFEDEEKIREAARTISFNKRQTTSFQTLRHPFYRDEIAWLYNERGLASLTQGLLFDAIPLFELASFLMSHKRAPTTDSHAFHAAERRIKLNYSIAQIERGNINRARVLLNELNESSIKIEKSTPSEIINFSNLYLGLCDHLTGGHRRAKRAYYQCLAMFSEKKQLRAVALSNRFLADLMRAEKDFDKAYVQAEMAVRAASQSEQRDIEHLALVSKARIEIELNNFEGAHSNITRALNYAKSLGLFSIEIDAKLAYAHLMNKQGDYELAGKFSSEAIALAVKNGLRLRKLSGLISFAETRISRGSIEFARRILKEIIREAEGLGCIIIASKATDLLSAHDDKVGNAGI